MEGSRREFIGGAVIVMASLLGEPMPSRFPRQPPQAPGVAPGGGQVLRARQVIIIGPSGALFVYNSTGTALLASIAGAAGNDPLLKQPYLPGFTSYSGTIAIQQWDAMVTVYQLQAGVWQGTGAGIQWAASGNRFTLAAGIGVAPANQSRMLLDYGTLQQGQQVTVIPSGDTGGGTDAANISYALAAGECRLLPGDYYVSGPITVPTGGILGGAAAGLYELTGTIIHATAGFSGGPMITFPTASQSQEIRDLCLDGSAMPAGTCDAIAPPSSPSHTVLSVRLENLEISGAGFQHAIGNINAGTSWRGKRVFAHSTNATAFNIQNAPDSCWIDCASLGAGNHGWQPFGAANSTFVGCRAEFSAGNGFNLSGAWGTGNGSGGLQFTGCSTDRNTGDGVFIDATGTAPVTFSGLMTRRDGNGTGNAGVHIAAGATVIPVVIGEWQCFPGVNDDGTGTLTPQFGLNVAGAIQYLGLANAFIHAATTATNGMTIANGVNWRAVATRTGSTSAPGAIALAADSA